MVKLRWVFLFLWLTQGQLLATELQTLSNARRFSIMTYNVHLFDVGAIASNFKPIKELISLWVETIFEWVNLPALSNYDDMRSHLIAKSIAGLAVPPEIIVFQEVWSEAMSNNLVKGLEQVYPYYYRPRGTGSICEGILLGPGLLLVSRHPITNTSFVRFSETSGFDSLSEKGIARASMMINDETPLEVVFTHTQENGSHSNNTQIANTVKVHRQTRPNDPIVIVGDLNFSERHDLYAAFLDALKPLVVQDIYRAMYPDAISFPGDTHEVGRIDYVFYVPFHSDFRVSQAMVVTNFTYTHPETASASPLSDHLPLLVEWVH